jgi:hypothetical protein
MDWKINVHGKTHRSQLWIIKSGIVVPVQRLKVYGAGEDRLHSLLTSAPDGCQCSGSRIDRRTHGGKWPSFHWLGEPQNRRGRFGQQNFSPCRESSYDPSFAPTSSQITMVTELPQLINMFHNQNIPVSWENAVPCRIYQYKESSYIKLLENTIIDKHQHMHFFTFKTVLV